ncbi:MAG: apolipoprotein N-acyltransferase [Acidobacteriales bacterium]|nr:apolipoprotein N-acyltransferase [Terriglobales bacterium]
MSLRIARPAVRLDSVMPRSRGLSWGFALLSGALQVAIFPSISWSALSWVAFVPLLTSLLHEDVRPLGAFFRAYLCGIVWYIGTCFWVFHTVHVYGGLPTFTAIAVVILAGLFLALYHAAFGLFLSVITRRAGSGIALMSAPFLWVAIEFARYHISGAPWDFLGTALVDNASVARIATWSGVYGVSFAVFAVNAMIASGFVIQGRTLGLAGVLLGVALFAGRYYQPPPVKATHMATLVQQDLPIAGEPWTVERFDRTLADLTELSRANTLGGGATPTLIVWPESPAPFYVNDVKFRSWLSALATDRKAYVIAGSIATTGPADAHEYFNSALLVAPTGAAIDRYDKVRLVPFGEYVPFQQYLGFIESLVREVSRFTPGQERKVLTLDGRKVGVFICYEAAFPGEVREFAANGAQVFVNISNDDWFGDYGAPGQHLNLARMRAIENHRWLLRATNSGITAAIDPYGRIVAQAPRHLRTTLQAPYGYEEAMTFYTRHGDWFPWTCAIISFVALVLPARRRRS